MMSTETPTQNQSQQTLQYDESVFDEHICQLFDSINSSSNDNMNQLTSIVDDSLPEQVSHCQKHHLSTIFDRFRLWNSISSASAFCTETTNRSSTLPNSSCPLRSTHYPYRSPLITEPSICFPSTMTIPISNSNTTNEYQRSSSLSYSTNINNNYQSHFINRLSTTLAGSHDQITGQSFSTPRLLSHNPPTSRRITTTSFCYISASDSLFPINSSKKD